METADKTSAPFNTYAAQSGIPTNILPHPRPTSFDIADQ